MVWPCIDFTLNEISRGLEYCPGATKEVVLIISVGENGSLKRTVLFEMVK